MPVEPATLAAFTLTAAAIVLSPGPDTFLILRSALSGRAAGYAAVLGVQLGLLVHTALAIFGLSLLISHSPVVFDTIAVAGALYLAYLGIQGLKGGGTISVAGGAHGPRPLRALRDAMLTNILNPKVLVLFLALYPNFVAPARGQVTAQLLILSATLIAINVAWQAPLAWGAHQLRRWLLRPQVTLAIARTASAVLIAFAVLLLYDHFL